MKAALEESVLSIDAVAEELARGYWEELTAAEEESR